MIDSLLRLRIIDAPATYLVVAVAAALLLVALLAARPVEARRRSRRRAVACAVGGAVGLLAASVVLVVVAVTNPFGIPLTAVTTTWILGCCAAIGAACGALVAARWWQRVAAILAVPAIVLAGAVGINADFGLNNTVATALGITVHDDIALPALDGSDDGAAEAESVETPVVDDWVAPADLPATGETGTFEIPNTVSGFPARDASIYLPPAALVADPPALPFVLMMMGSPGSPDPTVIASVLDGYAATHDGLAPIVIVADQLTDPTVDPLCLDTTEYGAAETYLTTDVTDWARANLNIQQDRRYWTIAGFSNGGQCAASLGAKHTDEFGNVIDVSGEEFPGSVDEAAVLSTVFGGDQAAYDAQKPAAIMAGMTFTDTWGVFTAGSDDPTYTEQNTVVYTAAVAAGMDARFFSVPGAGHDGVSLDGGLTYAFGVLYPRLGLQEEDS